MAKDLKEQIEIMTHYLNGGEIEASKKHEQIWAGASLPCWDWDTFDYRIKEQKQKVTIEKWLCTANQGYFAVIETSDIDAYIYPKKVKLLESYEIEL